MSSTGGITGMGQVYALAKRRDKTGPVKNAVAVAARMDGHSIKPSDVKIITEIPKDGLPCTVYKRKDGCGRFVSVKA